MAAVGVENSVLDAVPTSSLESTNAPELKSSEQTSTEQLASELKAPEEQPEQNGGLSESEVDIDNPVQGNGETTPSEMSEHGDVDASGDEAPDDDEEEAAEEPALKKQKTEEETAAPVNGAKKRGRGRPPKAGGPPKAVAPPNTDAPRKAGRPRKAGGPTAKAKAALAASPAVNGEKRKRGRPRKGEEINPKPARKVRVPPSPVVGTVGSRTRSRATG